MKNTLAHYAHLALRGLTWLGRHELASLIILALAASAIWGFVALADEVMEQETHAFDETILLAMRTPGELDNPWGPEWIEEMTRDFTALGGVGVMTLLTLAGLGYLLLKAKYRATVLLVLAVGGGLLLSMFLKQGFDRPRPDLVPHGSLVYTASFPSGHSMMAAVVYLTLAAMLIRVQPRHRVKTWILLVAVLVTGLVGISRVYLGVHWPTDVLAGWALGSAWALLVWLLAHFLQRRGHVENEAPPPPEE